MTALLEKRFFMEILSGIPERQDGEIVVSAIPPFFSRAAMDGPQPWLRLVIGLSGDYDPGYYHGEYRRTRLKNGDMLIVPPNCYLSSPSTCAGEHIQVIFRDRFIRYLHSANGENSWYHTNGPVRAEGLLMIRALDALPASDRFDLLRRDLIRALVRLAVIELEDDVPILRGKAARTYGKALEYIISNQSEELSRAGTAEAVGVTVSHLSRLFMQLGGMDFVNTVKKLRLERAELLLKQTSLAIKEIAELSGFKSDRHFIREFRRFYGTSPGRYRNHCDLPK